MRTIGLVVIAALLGACSFAFVHGPPPDQPQRALAEKNASSLVCTDSKVVPVLDAVWTAVMAINLIYAISTEDDQLFRRSIGIPLYSVGALAGGAGMYYGFPRVAACKRAHEVLIKEGIEKPELPRPGALTVPTAPL
jgi:hypothetical protein